MITKPKLKHLTPKTKSTNPNHSFKVHCCRTFTNSNRLHLSRKRDMFEMTCACSLGPVCKQLSAYWAVEVVNRCGNRINTAFET